MSRRKPLLAPLQQTNPCPTMGRNLQHARLRVRPRTIMLDMDQGSANSRRSSPGSGASTPLRDALNWSPPAGSPSVQPNHAARADPTHSLRTRAATMTRLTYHPACLLFPQLGKQELQELAEDIRQNGLQNDIVLLNGQILDGRIGIWPAKSPVSSRDSWSGTAKAPRPNGSSPRTCIAAT